MGSMSVWHWVILGIVVLLLFGKGRFSGMMGDVAKGLKEFKKGMAEDDTSSNTTPPPPRIDATPPVSEQNQSQATLDGKPLPPSDPRI